MTSTTDDTTTDTTTNGLSLVELAERHDFTMAWAPELDWFAVWLPDERIMVLDTSAPRDEVTLAAAELVSEGVPSTVILPEQKITCPDWCAGCTLATLLEAEYGEASSRYLDQWNGFLATEQLDLSFGSTLTPQ